MIPFTDASAPVKWNSRGARKFWVSCWADGHDYDNERSPDAIYPVRADTAGSAESKVERAHPREYDVVDAEAAEDEPD
jgi:hypothetical protein